MIDKVAKGRQIKGERVHTCRLTKEQVAEIRAAKPVGKRAPNGLPAQLATKYGVTKQYLSEIWSGKSWRQS
jgi:transcriptional regulator with XRE-family HTH domain